LNGPARPTIRSNFRRIGEPQTANQAIEAGLIKIQASSQSHFHTPYGSQKKF
jgi:hypothetical protein